MEPSASDFTQVVFHDIAEVFSFHSPLKCRYTVEAVLAPNSKDWIGLFKLGWRTVKEYVYFEWSPLPDNLETGREVDNFVIFKGKICFRLIIIIIINVTRTQPAMVPHPLYHRQCLTVPRCKKRHSVLWNFFKFPLAGCPFWHRLLIMFIRSSPWLKHNVLFAPEVVDQDSRPS